MKTELQPIKPIEPTKRTCFSYARVSSDIQATADRTGLDRQLEKARRVSREKGWRLDEKLSIVDAGVSAFKGKNVKDTEKLGALLKAVKEGRIPAGYIMIIEALDRLTRQEIDIALALIMDILRSGLEIYVDRSGRHLTKESLKSPIDLIVAIVELAAGNEYSAKLGQRVSDAWVVKKQRLAEDGKPYRYRAPGWLKWNDDKKCYDPIPEQVKKLERVFELANQGIGVRGIAKRMNAEGIHTIGSYCGKKIKSKIWANSTIQKLIHRKAVIGWNTNVTPPVQMFPAVIDEKLYYSARAKVEGHRTNKYYGRSSNKAQNLFTGLTVCGQPGCGQPMNIHRQKVEVTPLTGSKGGRLEYVYLRCEGVINGVCKNSMLRYDKIEESFASMLSGSAFVNQYETTKPEQDNQVEMIQGKIVETHSRLERYTADYEKSPSDMLAGLMTKTENEEKTLRQEMEQAKTATIGSSPLQDTRNELLAILYKGWYDVEVRLKLRELIRAVVEKIIIDGPNRSYTIYWRNKDKPTVVEVFSKAYKIDGMMMMASPHWEQDIIKAGEVIRQLELGKIYQAPDKSLNNVSGEVVKQVVKHFENGMFTKANKVDTAKEPVAVVKPSRKRIKGLTPLPDKQPA